MLKELINLANHLDNKGLKKEADFLDRVITKLSENMKAEEAMYDAGTHEITLNKETGEPEEESEPQAKTDEPMTPPEVDPFYVNTIPERDKLPANLFD